MAKDDLISRQAVLAALSSRLSIVDMVSVAEIVESVPGVEAEPVVHAHWGLRDLCGDGCSLIPYCSNCGEHDGVGYERCPHCGAHMDEEVSE